MKTPLAVALVVVGCLLIIAPIVADYLIKSNHQSNVVRLMEKPETNRVSLQREEMSGTYSFGCWLVGALAIRRKRILLRAGRSARCSLRAG